MIVLNIHHKHTVSDRIPRWATYFIFEFLPQWIFIQGPVKLEIEKRRNSRKLSNPEKALSNTVTMLQSNTILRRNKQIGNNKKSSLLASLAGSAGQEGWCLIFFQTDFRRRFFRRVGTLVQNLAPKLIFRTMTFISF